jgi:hypothetical protein
MKKIPVFALLLIFLTACSNNNNDVKSIVEGKIKGVENITFVENKEFDPYKPSYKEEEYFFRPYFDEEAAQTSGKEINLYDIVIDVENKEISDLTNNEIFYLLSELATDIGNATYYLEENLEANTSCQNGEMICKGGNIVIKTTEHEYKMKITPYKEYLEVMFVDGKRYKPKEEEIAYKEELAKKEEEKKRETPRMSIPDDDVGNTNSGTTPAIKWNNSSYSEKQSQVSSALSQIRSNGYTISEGSDYYITELDAFYEGNPSETTTVEEAIIMIGFISNTIY